MDAPIVILDSMPTNSENQSLSVELIRLSEAVSMLENTDEVLIGTYNTPMFLLFIDTLMPEIDFSKFDVYHRSVESYCTWLWFDIESAAIYYVTIR